MKITICYNVTNNTKTGAGKLWPGGNERPGSIMCPNQLETHRKPDPKPKTTVVNIIKI